MIVIGTYIPMHGVLPIILILAFTSWPYRRGSCVAGLDAEKQGLHSASTMMGSGHFLSYSGKSSPI